MDKLIIDVVEEKSQNMVVRQEDKDFIAKVYSYIFVGLMLDWVAADMEGEPELIVDKLATVIKGDITSALNRMRLDTATSK